MNKAMRLIIGTVVIASLLGTALWLLVDKQRTAPELKLQTATGDLIVIGADRGKPVLINFWATSCGACMLELPHLIKLYNELQPRGLDVIGVTMSYDPPIRVTSMVKEKQIPYPIVFDLDKKIQLAFGLHQGITPTTILIDARGKIRQRIQGVPDMEQLHSSIIKLLAQSDI